MKLIGLFLSLILLLSSPAYGGLIDTETTADNILVSDGTYFESVDPIGNFLPADPGADLCLMWDDAPTGELVWAACGGAGATAWDDITDPDADTTIAMGGYETVFTSTLDAAGKAVLKIDNTDADLSNETTLLWLEFTDNASNNGVFINVKDNNGDIVWQLKADGRMVIGPSATDYSMPTARGTDTQVLMTNDGGAVTWEDQFEINNLETVCTDIADDEVPVGSAAGLVIYKALPDCDASGYCLNYDTGTNAFDCVGEFIDCYGVPACEDDPEVGTVTNTKWCIGDAAGVIQCTEEEPGGATQEETDDWVDALLNDADSVHAGITVTYDDPNNAMDFVVDNLEDLEGAVTDGQVPDTIAISLINQVGDVDTVTDAPEKDEVMKFNGTIWVPAAYDYSFVFAFNSFSDNAAATQLIGSGVWEAIGDITFTATYDNGPPTSMVVVVTTDGSWESDSGWTDNEFEITAGDKTSEATAEANNYTGAPGDRVTFTATADEESPRTTTVDFENNVRWGVTTTADGSHNSASIEALSGNAMDDDKTRNMGGYDPSGAQYLAIAYPKRLGLLDTEGINFGGVTAGVLYDDISYTNSAGYTEDFYVYTTNVIDLYSSTFRSDQTLAMNWIFSDEKTNSPTINQAFIDSLGDFEASNDETQDAGSSGWTAAPGASEQAYLAIPDRLSGDLTAGKFRYYTAAIGQLQAAATLESDDLSYENKEGYTEDYDVWALDTENLGSGEIGYDTGSVRNYSFYGTDAEGTKGDYDETLIEAALTTPEIKEGIDVNETWGSATQWPDGEYYAVALPDWNTNLTTGTDYEDLGDDGTSFKIGGVTAGFQAVEAGVTIVNPFGYSDDYEVYVSAHARDTAEVDTSDTIVTSTGTTIADRIYVTETDTVSSFDRDDCLGLNGTDNHRYTTNDFTQVWDTVTLGAGEYLLFCIPERHGDEGSEYIFKDNDTGLTFAMQDSEDKNFLNEYGFNQDYRIFRSTNPNLGASNLETQTP